MKSLAISCFILGTALWLNHTAIRAQEPTHHHRSHAQRVAMDSATSDTGTLASAVKHHRRTPRHTPQHARAISPPPPPPPDTTTSEDQGTTAGFLTFLFIVWVIPATLPALIAKVKKRSFGHHFLRALWRSWILETITVIRLPNSGKASTIIAEASNGAQTYGWKELDFARSLYENDLTEAEQKKYSEFINDLIKQLLSKTPSIEKLGLTDLSAPEQKKLFALWLLDADQESHVRFVTFALSLSGKASSIISESLELSRSDSEKIDLELAQSVSKNINLTEAEQEKYSEFEAKEKEIIVQKILDELGITDLKASEIMDSEQKKIMAFSRTLSTEADPDEVQESLHRLTSLTSFLQAQ
ncbi:MAG: hypothetical protein ACHQNE_04430, partial [Candidatus Kapaibacterium sp.]